MFHRGNQALCILHQLNDLELSFGVFAAYAPIALLRYRVRQRRGELRDVWPDAVDNLASAVRAGLSLPEALTQLGVRGPVVLRVPFLRFGEDYRATGRQVKDEVQAR